MANESSGSFGSFWQKGVEKVSEKTIKFMPNVTKASKDSPPEDPTSKKQHRRAQVRKAQLEHRQRKANYSSHLEAEIRSLQSQITLTSSESRTLQTENLAMEETLRSANLPTTLSIPQRASPGSNFTTQDLVMNSQNPHAGRLARPHNSLTSIPRTWSSSPLGMGSENSDFSSVMQSLITVNFDEGANAPCLRVNPIRGGDTSMSVDSGYGKVLPSLSIPGQGLWEMGRSEELSTLAINFILALEHPCRTHFTHTHQSHQHPTSTSTSPFPLFELDPSTPSTNHELMASKILYAHAPAKIFPLTSHPSKFTTVYPSVSTNPPPSNNTSLTPLHFHFTSDSSLSPVPNPASSQNQTPGSASGLKASSSKPLIHARTQWPAPISPIIELEKLHQMSNSLSKEDWEITPVQAWFLLVERVGVEDLGLGGGDGWEGESEGNGLEEIKRGLRGLVDCFGFGAVINVVLFWEVVGVVFGQGGGF